MSEKWFLLEFTQRPMIVINSHCLVVMGVNTLTMEIRYSDEMGWWVPRIGCWETPYSNSGSKNGCASGPRLVHPHRRKEESSGDFLAKFPAQEKTKNAERPFLRPTSRPETGSLFAATWNYFKTTTSAKRIFLNKKVDHFLSRVFTIFFHKTT